jgi:hypothetical protein
MQRKGGAAADRSPISDDHAATQTDPIEEDRSVVLAQLCSLSVSVVLFALFAYFIYHAYSNRQELFGDSNAP